jgi:hypothetical protein
MKRIVLTALISSLLTLGLVGMPAPPPESTYKTVLENVRVKVVERVMPPGGVREPQYRGSDQVIVFLNDAKYERVDPVTGARSTQTRQAGEVIWHSVGEKAPQLTNVGSGPLRSLVINLK